MDSHDADPGPATYKLTFMGQRAQIVPGPVRCADDLLALPPDIMADVLRDIAIEEAVEALHRMDDR